MDSSVLRKYSTRLASEAGEDTAHDLDPTDDLGCFGWLRSSRDRCVMLELRKKSGNCLAIGYSWIERIEFDPSTGIVIVAGPNRIEIKGQNLNAEVRPLVRLFEGLTRHRVPWIAEAILATATEASTPASIVSEIRWA